MRCGKSTKWGKCKQTVQPGHDHCSPHERWAKQGFKPDSFYEEKLVKGTITPVDSYLTEAEIEATVGGRYRGDGRRIDQYTSDDPVSWHPTTSAPARRSPSMSAWLVRRDT